MRQRFLIVLGVLTLATLAATPLSAQSTDTGAATTAAKPFTPARTADNQPDLQGVWDFRTVTPLDVDTIIRSVNKTGRCLIVHEASRFAGFGAELSALVQERCFFHLKSPIQRVAGWDTPYPHAFEWDYFPGPKRIGAAMNRALGRTVKEG